MGFRSMVSSTLSSIAAITVGGVLTVIGIVREIRPLAIGGIVLAAMGVIFFIAAFIRAWRSLKQGEKEKGGPERLVYSAAAAGWNKSWPKIMTP